MSPTMSDAEKYCDQHCFKCIAKNMYQDMDKDFQEVISGRSMNWRFAKKALSRLMSRNTNIYVVNNDFSYVLACYELFLYLHIDVTEFFWEIFQFLINCYHEFLLEDITPAADLLRYGYFFANRYEKSLRCDDSCPSSHIEDKGKLFAESEFRKLMTMPYDVQFSVTRSTVHENQVVRRIVWNTVREGHKTLLFGLLRCGAMVFPSAMGHGDWTHLRREVVYILCSRKNCRLFIPRDFSLKKICQELGPLHCRPSYRTLTVLRVIELLSLELKKRENLQDTQRKQCDTASIFWCLRIAFEAIPEPFVSSKELRKVFKTVCGRRWDATTELYVNELIADYEKLYPEGAKPPSPRSLKHLSRCQVRENLRRSGTLTCGVIHLGLPELIQKYVLLES